MKKLILIAAILLGGCMRKGEVVRVDFIPPHYEKEDNSVIVNGILIQNMKDVFIDSSYKCLVVHNGEYTVVTTYYKPSVGDSLFIRE